MKGRLLAVSALAFVASNVQAQSSVTLYGLIDSAIVYTSNEGGGGNVGMASGATRGSRIGFLGKEDLGSGTKAIFRLENGFDVTDGSLGQGGLMFGRQAYVGLENDTWGKITLGRQYESMIDYVAQLTAADWTVYSEHPGDMDLTNRGVRVNNSVRYEKSFGGFTGSGLYSFGGQPGSFGQASMWSWGGSYTRGPLYAGFGMTYARTIADLSPGTFWTATNSAVGQYALASRSFLTMGGGVSYRLGHIKASAVMTSAKYNAGFMNQNVSFRNYEVNGVYYFRPDLSAGIGATYTSGKVDASGASPKYLQYNAIGTYSLSKATDLYAFATYQRALTAAGVAQDTQFIGASSTSKQVSVGLGIRHSF